MARRTKKTGMTMRSSWLTDWLWRARPRAASPLGASAAETEEARGRLLDAGCRVFGAPALIHAHPSSLPCVLLSREVSCGKPMSLAGSFPYLRLSWVVRETLNGGEIRGPTESHVHEYVRESCVEVGRLSLFSGIMCGGTSMWQ